MAFHIPISISIPVVVFRAKKKKEEMRTREREGERSDEAASITGSGKSEREREERSSKLGAESVYGGQSGQVLERVAAELAATLPDSGHTGRSVPLSPPAARVGRNDNCSHHQRERVASSGARFCRV